MSAPTSPPAPPVPASPSPGRAPLPVVSGTPKGTRERRYADNTGLVGKVLTRFPFLQGEDREEAYAAGLLGLWDACGRFDASRGVLFSSYAWDTVRGHVLRHLARRRRQTLLAAVSLETPIGEDGGELADVIADPQAERPGASLLNRAGFDALLSRLPVRQQEVLRGVYADERPLADIAQEMGVTKQRAGQIHLQALAQLRKGLAGQRQANGRAL